MKRQSEEIAPVTIEVLRPGEIEARRPRTNLETLDALVQQRVAEVLAARDEFVFEPFFRTRHVAYEIRRLQTVPERKKWAIFFERHGCLACHKQDKPHGSNGLCSACHQRVFQQLKQIISELIQEPNARE
jgi:CxxC motif-containing protein (DUF1111 family)